MATKATAYIEHGQAMGLVNGTRVGGTRRPSTYVRASDCVSHTINPETGEYESRIFRAAKSRKRGTKRSATVSSAVKRDILLMATMGTIHAGE